MNSQAINIIKSWFDKVEDWQKDLFNNIWKGNSIEESKNRAIKLIYKQYNINNSNFVPNSQLPNDINCEKGDSSSTILKEISNVQGVGALEPTKALIFENGLNVVYGENGCGKSSYVRILKKAENPKCDVKIHSNIFKMNQGEPKAKLTFEESGIINNINWNMANKDICPIKIYDTEMAKRFVEDSNEVIYEPKVLSVFTNMALVLENISNEVTNNIESLKNTLAIPDKEINDSLFIKEYQEIKNINLLNEFEEKLCLTDEEIQDLENINKNLEDNNLEQTKINLNSQNEFLDATKKEIEELTINLDASNVVNYLNLKKEKSLAKKIFEDFVNSNKNLSVLDGFGSDKWKEMWKAAKEYSVEEKSTENSDKRICLLCRQELSAETIKRMSSFEDIYKSNVSQRYDEISIKLEEETKKLQEIISERLNLSVVQLNLEARDISREIKETIIGIYKKLFDRANWMYTQEEYNESNLPNIIDISNLEKIFKEIFEILNKRINSIERFSKNVEEQVEKRKLILSKKWLIENTKDFNIKKTIINLENAKTRCKTNNITMLKKELSKIIITDAYIEKFKRELEFLNPQHTIKVELLVNAKKGKTYHQIVLKGAVEKKKTEEILSEGEYRVVSIAAFLADLSSWDKTQAFIFDDPITSLDHKFEDNVAKRIVKLATERQVIVFTHRLAFVELLNNNVKEILDQDSYGKTKFNYIELRRIPLGEPMPKGQFTKIKLKNTIKDILNEKIPKLKKAFAEGKYEAYDLQLKGLCSEVRDIIEKGIETDLLSGIVLRHERNISSKRIRYLKALKVSDIDFFDRIMTKYSYYDHSYSVEKPVSLPSILEIENDIKEIDKWLNEFNSRKKKYD